MSISKFSVVIPNYNNHIITAHAVSSALSQTIGSVEVIVVDNGSTDDSVLQLKTKFHVPNLKFIEVGYNSGFSYAVNRGIEISSGEFVALLNNDAEADKKWLENAYKAFNKDSRIVVVAPLVMNYHDHNIVDSAGDVMNIVGQAYSRGCNLLMNSRFSISKFVFSASGCASIYRKSIFDKVGLFDEGYFAYFEDLDLSWRIQKFGGKIWYEHKSLAYHRRNYTSRKLGNIEAVMFRNTIICYFTNTPRSLFFRRKSLLKAILVIIHTIFYLNRNKFQIQTVRVIFSFFLIKRLILALLLPRKPKKVTDEYLDSWRNEKIIKLLGINL